MKTLIQELIDWLNVEDLKSIKNNSTKAAIARHMRGNVCGQDDLGLMDAHDFNQLRLDGDKAYTQLMQSVT